MKYVLTIILSLNFLVVSHAQSLGKATIEINGVIYNHVDHTQVPNPVSGLLVFDTIDNEFWYYDGTNWNLLNATGLDGINCWDLNGNGVKDPGEDTNGDGAVSALDCQGVIGQTGPQGATGIQGAQGVQGANGPQGPAGVDGIDCWDLNGNGTWDLGEDKNEDGVHNALDCQGAVGQTGAQGVQGVQGLQGVQGATGYQGVQGATGPQGPSGADGISCWDTNGNGIWEGTEDTNGDGVFDPLDCQGVIGQTGPQGATGIQGAQGVQGPAGVDGIDCWDTNGNGVNDSAEDTNGDGTYNAADCQGDSELPQSPNPGEMNYWNGTAWVSIPKGVDGQTLTQCDCIPTWTSGGICPPPPSVTSATGRIWMDRNLGASQVAASSTDAASYGDLYQWGRGTDGHQIRTSAITTTLSSTDQPGHGDFIATSSTPGDWRSPQNDNLWQSVSGVNNPCPSGYRLPTLTEWDSERLSWTANSSVGAYGSPLKLPLTGHRSWYDGSFFSVGSVGYYWSSSVTGNNSNSLIFHSGSASMNTSSRRNGFSVRCIKD